MIEQRQYQRRIVENTLAAIEEGHRHVLITAPCGSGKTIMGHIIAAELHKRYGYDAAWCAMRRYLIRQAEEENQALIGFKQIRYFSMFEKDPPQASVLINDEGHHSAAESALIIYQKVAPRIHIGLSATPYRTDKMKLCFSKVIRDVGIRSLIDQGHLAPYQHYVFDGPWTPQNVAEVYLGAPERWGKTVIYFRTYAECAQCAELIRAAGVSAEIVWAKSDQEAQIEAFRAGRVPVLLNMLILTEGFNDPSLQTVMVRPGSRGPTIQMAGRVLRLKPDGRPAQIVQNGDTEWLFTKTASAQGQFGLGSDGRWRNRGHSNELVDTAIARIIQMGPYIRGNR